MHSDFRKYYFIENFDTKNLNNQDKDTIIIYRNYKQDNFDIDKLIKLKKSDLMYEVGFGLDFYLEYFKFSPEFKATFGFIDMLVHDESIYTSSIQKMLTHGFTFTLTFE